MVRNTLEEGIDEHGKWDGSGDKYKVAPLDYVYPKSAIKSPYHDMGNKGIALIEIQRTRWYSNGYHRNGYPPSVATNTYMIGKNECGTWFCHPVNTSCETVEQALAWIWGNRHESIIARQGDIALIKGKGPKGINKLPHGHTQTMEHIVHDTHPSLPLPKTGERIIVGKRWSADYVQESIRD